MKFKLILTKSDQTNRTLLLLPSDISALQQPIEIQREKKNEDQPKAAINAFQKRKSEIKEHFDPKYEKIVEEEKDPVVISSCDGRSYSGRYLDNPTDNYYVFINTGKSFKVIPIKKWYKFSQKINYDTLTLEEAEAILKEKNNLDEDKKWMMHNRKTEEEIDFDEVFDDDNSEEFCIEEQEHEELTKSGEELTKILKGNHETPKINEKKTPVPEKNEHIAAKENFLKESDLIKLFQGIEMTMKELISKIKKEFKINENEKRTIQKFIREKCNYRKDIVQGQTVKILFLKKQ